MVKNSLGRYLPEQFAGRAVLPYTDPTTLSPTGPRATRDLRRVNPGDNKVLRDLRSAIEAAGLKDGACIATHHHLRNGDALLNALVREIDALGLRDIRIASSSIHPVHSELIPYVKKGVISAFECGVNGPIGEAASRGEISAPIVVRSHGGRARAVICGDIKIDAAFIAAPCCDRYGNMNGYYGPSACGSLGYAHTDALYAEKVIAVTDHLVDGAVTPVSISQSLVDFVVEVDSLGDPGKIVSTTTRVTRDPVGLQIASYAGQVIEASGLLEDGFSFQTGAGGISLAVAERVRSMMSQRGVKGSFGCGGITGYFVDMLEEGLFDSLYDVQCFDLKAVSSIGSNLHHQEISADAYANPFNSGAMVNRLDAVILGATEVDVDFNVNVNTESNGDLLHNTGGHCDTAAGAKLSIITAPLLRGRLPIVRDRVMTVSTPGHTVDVIVTERGIAVNDRRPELKQELMRRRLPVKDINELHREACRITGVPRPVELTDEVIALIEYRDGSIIDAVRRIAD